MNVQSRRRIKNKNKNKNKNQELIVSFVKICTYTLYFESGTQ